MIGRKHEIEQLIDVYETGQSEFVAVYGRAVIGAQRPENPNEMTSKEKRNRKDHISKTTRTAPFDFRSNA